MQDIALFSRKIYTAGTNPTRPPVVTVATNVNPEEKKSTIMQIWDPWMKIGTFLGPK